MSHNIGGMAPFMNMPRGQNPMYYSPCPGVEPHPPMGPMSRPPFFVDDKMNHCRMGMVEFRPPMITPEPPPPKKKRRQSNNNAAANTNHHPPPSIQDLAPPPPSGCGDTIIASNPFDDTPPPSHPPMNVHNRHMACGPPMMMGPSGPPCSMAGSPMNCGAMSPMCGGPMIPSPMGTPNNRSPMCGGPPVMCGAGGGPGSPMPHRSPNIGSPMVDCIGPGGRKGSPMMGPPSTQGMSPMGSPIPNGPPNMCSINSPIGLDVRPINSPMCMNNGPQNNMQPPPACTLQSDMCNKNSVSVNSNGPIKPPQPPVMNHHMNQPPGHHPQNMNMYPGMHHPMAMQHPPHGYPPPKPMPVSAGKIYPVEQSMVFNPQNPNAPPIYPCGVCHKEVHDNDQAILCESGCNFWFHRICTGLTEHAFQMLTAEVYAEWVCDKCLTGKNIPVVKYKP